MADTRLAIIRDHAVDLLARCRYAGEMRGGRQRRLRQNPLDGRVRALARRSAGAVGDRDEVGAQRRKPCDRFPKRRFHLLGLGWKEFERDVDAARAAILLAALKETARTRKQLRFHQATSRATGCASTMRGSRPIQSETAILPSEPGSGARFCSSTTSRPAAFIHCVTVSAAK